MVEHRTDAELVAAHLSGDRSALAAIYDRYADPLHDTAAVMLGDRYEAEDLTHDVFIVASRKLWQLRQPERLRAWLFAVLRHEVFRRSARRRRARPIDPTASGMVEMTAFDPLAEGASVERAELALFVREAAAGLGERDQLLLELSARQGLAGADLADAMGVTQQQCHVLLHRMRKRVQRSISALTVARYGRKDCADLQALLAGWNGAFDELTRKRVAGHVDDCELCGETSREWAVPPLFSAAPALAVPAGLRDRVLTSTSSGGDVEGYRFDDRNGFPRCTYAVRRAAVLVAASTATLVMLGGTWLAVAGDDDTTAAAESSPPSITISPTTPATPTVAVSTSSAVPAVSVGVSVSSTTLVTTLAISASPATPAMSTLAVGGTSQVTAPPTVAVGGTSPVTAPPTVAESATARVTAPPTAASSTAPATTVASSTTIPTTVAVSATSPATAPTTPDTVVASNAQVAAPTMPEATLPAPALAGQLVASATAVDLGSALDRTRVVFTNTGERALDWALRGELAPFVSSTTAGSLLPGEATELRIGIDRYGLPEGEFRRTVGISSSGDGDAMITVTAAVERPPVVTPVSVPSTLACPAPIELVTVTVMDESRITSVELTWIGVGIAGASRMIQRADDWIGLLAPERINGAWTLVVHATDERGNVGSSSAPFLVVGC
jgi:RNA polymerase sigma factor (sigma-70 family)